MERSPVDIRSMFITMDTDRFKETFDSEEKCLEILAASKWKNGFVCHKCGGNKYGKGKKPYSRRCTSCKQEESVTAHTIFHHCRIDLPRAFEIAYRVCGTPGITASSLSQILETRHMTCLNFKKKILECVASHGDFSRSVEPIVTVERTISY
ncbi:MAG: transposase [Bacteroidales bacterium]|nr:transposase [Bacteroidales bacterium]